MAVPALDPLSDVSATPEVAVLPKADLHLHQEVFPRLERIVARQQGREPYAWSVWARQVMDTVPAGPGRLEAIYRPDHTLRVDRSLDNDPELFITRVADVLAEAAADGAIYVEVRFGADRLTALPDFMALFREAEQRVQARHPRLRAEAIGYVEVWDDAERLRAEEEKLNACLGAARHGLGGIDLLVRPYDATDDPQLWETAYRWAERATSAGLGITVHVGEFATTSITAALRTPGLRRIGHGTHVADDPHLLEDLASSGVLAHVQCRAGQCPRLRLPPHPTLRAARHPRHAGHRSTHACMHDHWAGVRNRFDAGLLNQRPAHVHSERGRRLLYDRHATCGAVSRTPTLTCNATSAKQPVAAVSSWRCSGSRSKAGSTEPTNETCPNYPRVARRAQSGDRGQMITCARSSAKSTANRRRYRARRAGPSTSCAALRGLRDLPRPQRFRPGAAVEPIAQWVL
jgi:hypothetical protein